MNKINSIFFFFLFTLLFALSTSLFAEKDSDKVSQLEKNTNKNINKEELPESTVILFPNGTLLNNSVSSVTIPSVSLFSQYPEVLIRNYSFIYMTENFLFIPFPFIIDFRPLPLVQIYLNLFIDQARFYTFLQLANSISLGPLLELNIDTLQYQKYSDVQLIDFQIGGKFRIYFFHLFLGHFFFNRNATKTGSGFNLNIDFYYNF